MQLKYEQLHTHLRTTLAPLYWLSGNEPLLLQEGRLAIREQARQAGYAEQIFIPVETGFRWQDFYQQLQNLPLFTQQRLFDLRLAGKIDAQNGKILQQLAQSPPADTIVLLSSPKLETAMLNTAWYKTLAKTAVCVTIWPLEQQQLAPWLKQRCQQAHLQLTPAALTLFAEWVEGNLLAAVQTIHKLQLLYPNQTLDIAEISVVVEDEARFDIFKLVDSALQGDLKRCLRALARLKAEGTEPTLLLWAISRELRALAQMAGSLAQGLNFERISQEQHVMYKRKSLLQQCLQRIPLRSWYKLIQQAAQVDRIIKGVEPGDSWDALQDLLLELTLSSNKTTLES